MCRTKLSFALALGLVDLGFEQSSGKRGCGMDDLTREFLIESQEGLDRMERCLTELELSLIHI